jgi:hypothetical protein
MRQLTILTLRIRKSLYPWANLDAVGKGFIATCTEEEANKLMEDSAVTVSEIVEMHPINMP